MPDENGFLGKGMAKLSLSSIRLKIALLVAAAITMSLAVASVASGWREAERRFVAKTAELNGIAAAIAANVEAGLTAHAPMEVQKALRAVGRIPGITYVRVVGEGNVRIAEFGNGVVVDGAGRGGGVGRQGLFRWFSLKTYPVDADIISGGAKIGTLSLIADLSSLGKAFQEAMEAALLTSFTAAVAGFAIAFWLQRYISKPIGDLTRAMREVRATADFNRHVVRESSDETGELVDAFNEMLSEIRARDNSLREHRDHLEATVQRRTHELELATEAAVSANLAKSDFLATMSHEIRTPMNGMLVMAELLAAGKLDDRSQRYAEVIVKSGQSLLAIINDILDFSKIEAGKLQLESIPLDPVGVADDVARLFGQRAAAKAIDLAVVMEPDVPLKVVGDPVRLTQILTNLVNNALKFTEVGGVTIEIGRERATASDQCRVRFSVRDTGIGIPADRIEGIFEAFAQADQSTTRRFGGTGIGLTICQRLVVAMGGTISVESQVGRGSAFHVIIDFPASEAGGNASPKVGRLAEIGVCLDEGPTRTAVFSALLAAGATPVAVESVGDAGSMAGVIVHAKQLAAGHSARLGVPVIAIAALGDTAMTRLQRDGLVDCLLSWPVTVLETMATVIRTIEDPSSLGATVLPASEHEGAVSPLSGVRVLAADDSAVNREVLTEALNRLGVIVTCVENGAEAVSAVERESFDLVFMDASMPVMDGFTACRTIRAAEVSAGRPTLPIVALTAHVVGRQAEAWRDAGMNDCVTKPFTLAAIEACLLRWVDAEAIRDRLTVVAGSHGGSLDAGEPAEGAAAEAQGGVGDERPLIDWSVLDEVREFAGPSNDLVDRVIKLFAGHAPTAASRLGDVSRDGDGAQIASAAHALKSMCRNIGAVRLGEQCEVIESAAREHGVRPTVQQMDILLTTLQETIEALGPASAKVVSAA